MILSESAEFDLARRLRSRERATLGEVFAFLSGLYFRGKLAYANTFARTAEGICGVLVLRSAVDKTELTDISVMGAVRSCKRPPTRTPRRYYKQGAASS